MKKIFAILFLIVCFYSSYDVYAADIGYVKFNIDMSQSGCSSDAKVIVDGISYIEGIVSYSFNIAEYGNQWSYYFDAGSYRISISDKYQDEWCYEYDGSPFIITGTEENGYICNIKITRPEGYIEKEDEDEYEEPHYKALDKTENSETNRENEENSNDSNEEFHSVLSKLFLIGGGIILLAGTVFIMLKLSNRKNR